MTMTACDWPVTDCDGAEALAELSPERAALVREWAVDLLWHATGEQYGSCPVTARPCRPACEMDCGSCRTACGCSRVSRIRLPGPVSEILGVRVDGVDLDPADTVRVYNHHLVYRIDGERWPAVQDLSLPDGEPGTWSITYQLGYPVPPGAGIIAGLLAEELAKACDDQPCRLPRNVTSVTRQGVSIQMPSLADLGEGAFGIFEVDSWVAMHKRTRQTLRATSPDIQPTLIQTWPDPNPVAS